MSRAQDAMLRKQITDSCRVVKSHASFIGCAAQEIVHMPTEYTPACMDEINEAEGVLQRAMERIERAKQSLLNKSVELSAAE